MFHQRNNVPYCKPAPDGFAPTAPLLRNGSGTLDGTIRAQRQDLPATQGSQTAPSGSPLSMLLGTASSLLGRSGRSTPPEAPASLLTSYGRADGIAASFAATPMAPMPAVQNTFSPETVAPFSPETVASYSPVDSSKETAREILARVTAAQQQRPRWAPGATNGSAPVVRLLTPGAGNGSTPVVRLPNSNSTPRLGMEDERQLDALSRTTKAQNDDEVFCSAPAVSSQADRGRSTVPVARDSIQRMQEEMSDVTNVLAQMEARAAASQHRLVQARTKAVDKCFTADNQMLAQAFLAAWRRVTEQERSNKQSEDYAHQEAREGMQYEQRIAALEAEAAQYRAEVQRTRDETNAKVQELRIERGTMLRRADRLGNLVSQMGSAAGRVAELRDVAKSYEAGTSSTAASTEVCAPSTNGSLASRDSDIVQIAKASLQQILQDIEPKSRRSSYAAPDSDPHIATMYGTIAYPPSQSNGSIPSPTPIQKPTVSLSTPTITARPIVAADARAYTYTRQPTPQAAQAHPAFVQDIFRRAGGSGSLPPGGPQVAPPRSPGTGSPVPTRTAASAELSALLRRSPANSYQFPPGTGQPGSSRAGSSVQFTARRAQTPPPTSGLTTSTSPMQWRPVSPMPNPGVGALASPFSFVAAAPPVQTTVGFRPNAPAFIMERERRTSAASAAVLASDWGVANAAATAYPLQPDRVGTPPIPAGSVLVHTPGGSHVAPGMPSSGSHVALGMPSHVAPSFVATPPAGGGFQVNQPAPPNQLGECGSGACVLRPTRLSQSPMSNIRSPAVPVTSSGGSLQLPAAVTRSGSMTPPRSQTPTMMRISAMTSGAPGAVLTLQPSLTPPMSTYGTLR